MRDVSSSFSNWGYVAGVYYGMQDVPIYGLFWRAEADSYAYTTRGQRLCAM